jgi:nucleotide-binding universal stress UspA family protein
MPRTPHARSVTDVQMQPALRGAPRVVVGVDGSPSSIGALRRGVRIAAALGLPLEAVAVWHYPNVYGGYSGEVYVPSVDVLVDGAQDMINDTVTAVFGDAPRPSWFHESVREGQTALALLDESEGAEMLIVGSRGHGGFAGLLLGSVSERCAEHATCPVLVCHDEVPEAVTA